MELNDILNIDKSKSVEDKVKEAIKETKEELIDLTDDKTCMIYSSYLYDNLKKRHVLSRIIDSYDDLKLDYKHRFVLALNDSDTYFLIDLTYSQFLRHSIDELLEKGYVKLNKDDNLWKSYLMDIGGIVPEDYLSIDQSFRR